MISFSEKIPLRKKSRFSDVYKTTENNIIESYKIVNNYNMKKKFG